MAYENDLQTGAIIAAAVEVHKQLGHGFLEAVYTNALAIELADQGVPFSREIPIPVFYKGVKLTCGYRADFLCFGLILVEVKAQSALTPVDEAQVVNYLRGTTFEKALLLNFGLQRLQIRRMVLTKEFRQPSSDLDIETTEYAEDR